jgi:orotate phosphoribosyltransferase
MSTRGVPRDVDTRCQPPGDRSVTPGAVRARVGATFAVVPERVELPPLEPARQALREHVLRHSVRRGAFTLKSGATSTWFLDTKQTACRADGVVLMADVGLSLIPDDVTAIGGLTVGGDPVAYALAAIGATRGRRLSSFTVRKEAKGHGITGRVAGALAPGDRVVVTEDTVTRGTSVMEAVAAVREFGAEPVLIIAIVDRGGTCAAMAEAEGIPFRPMLTAPDLGFAFGS